MLDDHGFEFSQLDPEEQGEPYAQRARQREADQESAWREHHAREAEEARVRAYWHDQRHAGHIQAHRAGTLHPRDFSGLCEPDGKTVRPKMERPHAPAPSPPKSQGGRGVQPRTRLIIRERRRDG